MAAESSPQRPFLQRLILSAALAVLGASLLFCIDFAAMRTLYRAERILLEDVTHFPTFSSELANTNPELNSDFIRDTREASAFPAEATNLVVLGDSFAYGFRVWPQEALPMRLQERARERHPERAINVANFGWVSSSPYLSHKVLQSIGAKYHPDLVVMMVDMTDIHDDIVYEKYAEKPGVFAALSVLPSAVLAAKDVARHAGTHERWFGYPAERFFHIERPLSETRPYFDAYLRKNLDALNHYATGALHAKFLVVVVPRYYQYSHREAPMDWERSELELDSPYLLEPFRWFDELSAQADYPVFSLLDTFRRTKLFPTTFYDDPHWNPAAHDLAAAAVLDAIEARGLLEPGSR